MAGVEDQLNVVGFCFGYDEEDAAELYERAIGDNRQLDAFAMRFGNMHAVDVFTPHQDERVPLDFRAEQRLVTALHRELLRRRHPLDEADHAQLLGPLTLTHVLEGYAQATQLRRVRMAAAAADAAVNSYE